MGGALRPARIQGLPLWVIRDSAVWTLTSLWDLEAASWSSGLWQTQVSKAPSDFGHHSAIMMVNLASQCSAGVYTVRQTSAWAPNKVETEMQIFCAF